MCVGHVDVKFSLHQSCQLIPSIQVTLLRLKNSSNTGSCSESGCCRSDLQDYKNKTSFSSSSKDTSTGKFILFINVISFLVSYNNSL